MSDDQLAGPAIPETAKRYLQANPQLAEQFDAKYGAGASAGILAPPSPGLTGTLGDMAKGVARGAVGAVNETADAIDSGAKWLGDHLGDIRYTPGQGIEVLSAEEARARNHPRSLSSLVTGQKEAESALFTPRLPNFAPTETTAGQLTEGVSQFVTGLVGLGKFTKLAKLDGVLAMGGKVADAAIRSATVSSVAFDPYDGNLANFVERFPSLQNPVTEFLAVGDDDGEAEARLKNALADVVGGVPLDLALKGLKALRASKQGRLEAAEKHLEDLADADAKEQANAAQGAPEEPSKAPEEVMAGEDVQRFDMAGAAPRFDKPHGLYTTPAGVESPHADIGPNKSTWTIRPDAKVLRLADDVGSDSSVVMRTDAIGAGAGVHAAKELLGTAEFSRLKLLDKEALIKEAGAIDAVVDWSRYHDTQEIMEGIGGTLARQRGYDVISLNDADPRWSERVILNESAVKRPVAASVPESLSAAEVAAQKPKLEPELKSPPVKLADDVAHDLAEKMKDTVRTVDSLEGFQRQTGVDPWRDFFTAGHDFNFQKILSTGGAGTRGALAIMEDIGETFRPQIDAARGGATRSFESVKASAANMARMTGNDPQEFLAGLVSDAKSMKAVESRLYAYKNFTLSLADNVKRLAQMLEQGTHGAEYKSMDEVRAQFAHRAEFLANVQAMTKAVQTGTARAVSAGRLGAKLSPAMARSIEEGKFGGVSKLDAATIDRMAKAVAGGAPEEVLQATRMSIADRAGNAVYRYWINSILSGPATHIVNATSNFMKGAAQAGEEYLAGVYSGNAKQRAVAARTFTEMANQTVESWRVARKALNAGDNILDRGGTVMDRDVPRQVSAEELAEAIENGQYGAAILRSTSALFNLPTRLLATEDEFFKQVSYRGRVAAKAQVDGAESGLKEQDLKDFVDKRMADAFDADGAALDEDALAYARETTFTTPLTPGSFSFTVQMAANSSPWMRMVLPFVKTPANVLYDWAYRSGAHFDVYRDLAAGGERRAKAAARLTVGAAFYSTAGLLVNSGSITGMGPQDPETKKLWKAAGNQPYSIKVGDKWVSYNRMDPFGMFFGIAADVGELAGHLDDRELDDLGTMALVSFSRNLSNKTYLRGLADVMDTLFERDAAITQKAERLMQSYASGFVPFSGALNGIKDDPLMREVRSMADAATNRVPGLSDSLDPQRNILGEVTLASDIGGISPWAVTKQRSDKLGEELVRIHEATGEQMQKPPKKTGDVDWTTFKDAKGRSAYDRFLALHEELGLRKEFGRVMQAPGYKLLSDSGRVEMFRSVLSRVRSAAKATTFKEFPELRDAATEQERLQRLGFLAAP